MKRVLCVRFLNWPVQRQRRLLLTTPPTDAADGTARQPSQQTIPAPLAVCTATHQIQSAPPVRRRRRTDVEDADWRFVRSVFPAARNGPAVIAVSEEAWAIGVRPGMPLADARSMARPPDRHRRAAPPRAPQEVRFVEWQPWEDRQELLSAAELLRRFSPLIGLDEMPLPDSLLLDVTGCAHLFGGESALAEQLLSMLRQAGYRCKVCTTESVAAAWALTHPQGHGLLSAVGPERAAAPSGRRARHQTDEYVPILIVPSGQARDQMDSLPLAAGRIPTEDIQILRQLGLYALGPFLQLPREDLPARLSDTAQLRAQQLVGIAIETICGIPEANPVMAVWSSEFPASDLQQLQQVLEHLVHQVGRELLRRSCGCLQLTCHLLVTAESTEIKSSDDADDDGTRAGVPSGTQPVLLTVEVVRPTQDVTLLIDVLKLRLERLNMPGPVGRVTMHAMISPLPVARQRDLFSDTEHLVPQEELAGLINRLNGRLGYEAITTVQPQADPRPEFAYQFAPLLRGGPQDAHSPALNDNLLQLVTPQSDPSTVPAISGCRPIRLLASPFLLSQQDQTHPLRQGFTWQGQRFAPQSCSGPERLQTAWWTDHPIHRDYYRVLTTTGSLFWIFRDLLTSDWYLHGIFD